MALVVQSLAPELSLTTNCLGLTTSSFSLLDYLGNGTPIGTPGPGISHSPTTARIAGTWWNCAIGSGGCSGALSPTQRSQQGPPPLLASRATVISRTMSNNWFMSCKDCTCCSLVFILFSYHHWPQFVLPLLLAAKFVGH